MWPFNSGNNDIPDDADIEDWEPSEEEEEVQIEQIEHDLRPAISPEKGWW